MSDIDILTDLRIGFQISMGDGPQEVSGNRLLMNIFEITFLTDKKEFSYNGISVTDNYGGGAGKNINSQSVLSDVNSISASIIVTINETVASMQADESDLTPLTEKIAGADLVGLNIVGDTVFANILIRPVAKEAWVDLEWRLPIIKRN